MTGLINVYMDGQVYYHMIWLEIKSSIIKNATDISNQLISSRKDDCFKETLYCLSNFLEQPMKEMNSWFNDTALTLIEGCSIFKNYRSFSNSSIKIIEQLCNCFSLNENEKMEFYQIISRLCL